MNNEQILTSMLHTVQMGQSGIRCIMENAIHPGLKSELRDQLKEYDALEKQTLATAKVHGLKLKNLSSAVQTMSSLIAKAQLIGGERDSKIAGMLIQGNTRGMIQGMKNLRKAAKASADVKELAQRILNRENINIQKAQPFL